MLVGGGLLKMCELDITDNTIFGHCSNCGECCTDYLIITDKELKAIKKYLKHHPEIHDMTRPVLCPFRDPIECDVKSMRSDPRFAGDSCVIIPWISLPRIRRS
jgi:Fe-S-cluster containining protein